MKALILSEYGSPDDLRVSDVDRPEPKANEVLVRVYAASVNDWDWAMVCGSPFYIRLMCGLFRPKIRIPGVDVAGTVTAVGADIKTLEPGDNVYGDLSECGFGAFAEFVCVPETAVVKMPDDMSFEAAAALPHAAMLAVQALFDYGQFRPGQKLLFNGAGGGMGSIGVQIAKAEGATDITGVDSGAKTDMMIAAGFGTTIDYQAEDFTKSGKRYDLILDAKTTRSPFAYLRALAPGGTYATVGGVTGRVFQAFLLGPVIRWFTKKHIRVVALKTNKDMDFVNTLYNTGKLRPVIDGPYPLSDLPKALQCFGEGRHKGKVVISIGQGDRETGL